MTGLVNAYGNTPRETETYTYYLDGNKKSVTDMTGKLTQYTYDNAGRLTAETVDSTVTSYTYDGYNNRIGKTKNGVQTVYDYDSRNRLTKETVTDNGQTAVTSYQYDPNGNLYSRQTLTFAEDNTQEPKVSAVLMGYTAETDDMLLEYNNFNQLTATTGDEMVSYDYYPNGMRKSKTVDGFTTTHIWDGQNISGEITEDNFTGYLRGARLIARQMGDNTQYYHFNGHGDTSSITDGNGTTLRNYTYDAFGNLENLHDLDTNPFRYCGEYYDAETGFIYLRNRYYDPSMGRFISEDPVRDGLNWYAYCNNNPVNYIDPLGLWMTGDENLPQWAQDTITVYTATWNSAKSDSERNIAHQGADAVRTFVATYYQSRSDWGAGMSTGSMDSITGARADYYNKLTYHHTNRPQYESMKSLQQAEQAGGEYSDVPYHFVIDGNGTVYEGRSLQYMGAHVKHDNPGNIGLALMGNFEENASLWQKFKDSIQGARFSNPTSIQVNNAKQMAVFLDVAYGLPTIGGHRSFADGYTTDCPGSRLTELLSPTYKNVYFWRSAGGK